MPAKSRRKRGKNIPPSKRGKEKTNTPPVTVMQQAVAQAAEPVSTSDIPAKPEIKPVSSSIQKAVRYPHIAAELWTIGILAVIMLAILTVLSAVL